MINASKEFKEKLKNGANVVNYADFTLSDGTMLHLEPKDFMIGGCQIEDKTTDGKFGVGFCIGKTLTIRIANHDERFSQYDFYNSIINLYVALLLDNGTVEKIRKGVYYTIVPETPGNIIEISAVDGMFKLDRDYSFSKTTYPATLQRIISDACLDCGIPIGFRQFDNMSYTVKDKPEQGTYRQILSYACQVAGYNARIDNNGYMQLVWYNTSILDAYNYNGGNFKIYPHNTIVNGGDFTDYSKNTIISGGTFADDMPLHIFRLKSINVHTDDVQITGVKVIGENEKSAISGEEGYLIEVKENPFANGNEQDVANYLGTRMVGMVFRPLSAKVLNNPLYEPFDVAMVSDEKGNVYYTVLNSISYEIGRYTTVACEAEDPVRNGSEYVSAAAQAVVEARRNTEKQLTTYDKAVQDMNQLTANAMGLFTKSEKQSDGSSIFYQSTKPITVDENGKCHFEAGSTVYKKQGEGFFVSRDGGNTYSSGFDADGNAVLNVLYAIGIVCDWIRGGTLTLGGKDNGNGTFSLLNEKGKVIATIDNTGFQILSGIIAGPTFISKGIGSIGSGLFSLYTKIENGAYLLGYNLKTSAGINDGIYNAKIDNFGNGMRFIAPYFNPSTAITEFTPQFAFFFDPEKNSSSSSSVLSIHPNVYSGDLAEKGKRYATAILRGNLIIDPYTASGTSGDSNLEDSALFGIGWEERARQHSSPRYGIYPTVFGKGASNARVNGTGIEGPLTCENVTATSLSVAGYKSRISDTENYGKLHQYCYEMATPYFGDIGSGTTDENGDCYVSIDDKFLETCSGCPYYVFLQKEGEGDIWIEKKEINYFIVKGTPNINFSWEIKQKQKEYENYRLDSMDAHLEMEVREMNIDEIYQDELLAMEDFYEQQYYTKSN